MKRSIPRTRPANLLPLAEDSRQSATERAYRALRRLILDNELPAGGQLLEIEAATMLGMSRTPVREAMVKLEQDGLVELRARHGMRVLPLSATDISEIYEVITALEGAAAEAAARKGLSEESLASMRQALRDMDSALARDDLKAWSAADERFHRLLVNAAGNKRLTAMLDQVWDQSHRARMATLRLRPKPVRSNEDHAALVEMIVARNPRRARQVHELHRRNAAKMLVELIDHLGLKQL